LISAGVGVTSAVLALAVAWGVMRADLASARKALSEQRQALEDDRAAARREMAELRRELVADINRLRAELTTELRSMRDEARTDAASERGVAIQVGELRGIVDALPCRHGGACKAQG
jgi:F0F1-type ATP synthase membrane subunit b/b'